MPALALLALPALLAACSSAVDVADEAPIEPGGTQSVTTTVDSTDGNGGGTDQSTSTERVPSTAVESTTAPRPSPPELGVERLVADGYRELEGRRVGLITNQVSIVDGRHLIDLLAEADGVGLVRIFAAEHGVRGVAGAGEPIGDGVDDTTGVPIRSLYGATRQPTDEMLTDLDTIVFDLQDVGTRYYTYTATMGLAMQAAARADVEFVVLDRPNPLGRLVEGDLRTDDQTSFIGQYPIPSLHGLTAGELALMIVGEAWLPGLDDLDLRVIEMDGWNGAPWLAQPSPLEWIAPSPGLQSAEAATTYPTIVWFEATTLSYGAGTDLAFRAVGAPWLDAAAVVDDMNSRGLPGVAFAVVELAPVDIPDVVVDPRFEGEVLPGVEVIVTDVASFRPSATGLHLLEAVITSAPDQPVIDRGAVFDLLAGTGSVRSRLLAGEPVADIIAGWDDVAAEFQARSFAYQLY